MGLTTTKWWHCMWYFCRKDAKRTPPPGCLSRSWFCKDEVGLSNIRAIRSKWLSFYLKNVYGILRIFLLDTAAVSKTGMLKTMMLQGHFLTERYWSTTSGGVCKGHWFCWAYCKLERLLWWMFPCFTSSKTLEANLMTCPPATSYRLNFPAEVVGGLWSWEIQYRFWRFQLGCHGCIKFGWSLELKSWHLDMVGSNCSSCLSNQKYKDVLFLLA